MAVGINQPSRRSIVPAVWAAFYAETRIPAAVLEGEALRLTGHTGETADGLFSADAESQIRQVFRNIELTLVEAAAQWSDVVEVTTYRVGLRAQGDIVLRVAAEFLDAPYPAWTDVGITDFDQQPVVGAECQPAPGKDRHQLLSGQRIPKPSCVVPGTAGIDCRVFA